YSTLGGGFWFWLPGSLFRFRFALLRSSRFRLLRWCLPGGLRCSFGLLRRWLLYYTFGRGFWFWLARCLFRFRFALLGSTRFRLFRRCLCGGLRCCFGLLLPRLFDCALGRGFRL